MAFKIVMNGLRNTRTVIITQTVMIKTIYIKNKRTYIIIT